MQLTSIYVIYPLVVIIALPLAYIISFIVINTLVMKIDFSSTLLKIYLIFCICYIIIFCINKMQLFKVQNKLLNNKFIFIICIVSSLCFSLDYFILLVLCGLEAKQVDYFGRYIAYLEYCGIIIFAIISYFVLLYFLKKAVFIRKKLISYSSGKQRLIWSIICFPLILDVFEIENFHCILSDIYFFSYFHLFWLMLELLTININIFYIFRPYYAIENRTYYDITLKNQKQFTDILFSDYKNKNGTVKIKVKNTTYFIFEKDIIKIREYKNNRYILLNKKFYIIKSFLLWIIELTIIFTLGLS